jgi:UrcA family protein
MSTSARFHTRAICGLAALAAVAVTAVGIADGVKSADLAVVAPSVNVTYADLDLSQPAGARQLFQRLQRASKAVCGSADQMNLAAYMRWQSCYSEALQRAVLRVNAPELLALYRSNAGHAAHG